MVQSIGYHIIYACLIMVIFSSSKQVNALTDITKAEGSGDIVWKNGIKELGVVIGETIALTCRVDGSEGLVEALWFGPLLGISFRDMLLHPDPAKYNITVQRAADNIATEYTIRIYDVGPEDEGHYRCQGILGLHDNIEIVILIPANIISITDLQIAQEGDAVSLWCIAEGHPEPQVQWRHMRPNNRLPNGLDGIYFEGFNLNIPSITLEDRGEYECIATNGIPEDNSTVTNKTYIRMEYKPIVEAIVDGIPFVEVLYGQATSLKCKSMAYPRVSAGDVKWYLEDDELSEAGSYSWEVAYQVPTEEMDLYNETTFSVLQIVKVNSSAAGQYKCQFENTKGPGYAVIQLKVSAGSPIVTEDNSEAVTISTPASTTLQHGQWKFDSETKIRPLGPIIGGVFAGIFIIGIIIIVLVLFYRFKKKHEEKSTPYHKFDHTMEPKGGSG